MVFRTERVIGIFRVGMGRTMHDTLVLLSVLSRGTGVWRVYFDIYLSVLPISEHIKCCHYEFQVIKPNVNTLESCIGSIKMDCSALSILVDANVFSIHGMVKIW
jgi:hypothetical protein